MDVTVTRSEGATVWTLADLLGRSMGMITEVEGGFVIAPAGEALEAMRLVARGPHASLDAALAEIETRTRGVCRCNF
ncbi:MAG: hypothetical protein JWM36_1189 [Hyphomicrobiales bacterium]|nr:hypothetical protein [Hyphomicrobiales bacterium]